VRVTTASFDLHTRASRPLVREACITAGAALALATALVVLLPPGSDFAAHEYQLSLYASHGWTLWDNFWYSGRYTFITYSVLYYPLAALFGIKLLALIAVAVAAGAFTVVTERQWGWDAIWASRVFALVWAAFVVTAAFPFALGVALGALALAAMQVHARRCFVALALLTLLASPLAFALLTIVALGALLARRRPLGDVVALALPLTALALTEVALWRLFPDPGHYPFPVGEFVAAATFCLFGVAATWHVERARALAFIFLTYLVACSAAFVLPSAVGENIARLRFMALPLAVLALSLRYWRPRAPAIALLALAATWNLSPLGWVVDHNARDSAHSAVYWADTIAFLHARLTSNNRVEVVDTASHWASYYLARRGIPLARGWYRQDDFPQNAALYGDLTSRRYLAWLHSLAVRYVVLPDVSLDYSSRAEAALIQGQSNPLRPVARLEHATVFAVPHARPIATGPGRAKVGALTSNTLAITVSTPGRYRVSVRYSPYWRASRGCVTRAADGSVALLVPRPGRVRLALDVGLQRMLATLIDRDHRCTSPT
jgi:hypothetical protein